jgi:hypothetical protein
MEATENRTQRRQLSARPRINTQETGEMGDEYWHRRALILTSDIVRLVGPAPEGECEREFSLCPSYRRPCSYCYGCAEWEQAVLAIVSEATGWGLNGYGLNSAHMTGRPFAREGQACINARHPKVVTVTWSGGWDI